jgi:eukaryotic-like serine/threonine-protein kinase
VAVVTRTGLILDDRYQLNEPIAAGGVGQVWRAADLLLDRPVAVKLLRPEYADHPETLERFRAEAKHAGSLTHPCIARIYDYSNSGPTVPPYLVMEFVNGPSLADVLAADTVDPVLALDVVAQAAAGLDAAHRSGLVHRDIKPGNILIGEDGLVKVTDFGIAHAAGSAPITGPGVVMGTTQYMAPERIAGAPATPASDLYSLGILIYECLTGLPPYDGGTAEVMAGHLYLPLPPLPAGVPPELDELIARLTAKDPAARLADAAELATTARRLRDMLAAERGLTIPDADASRSGAAPVLAEAGVAAGAVPAARSGRAAGSGRGPGGGLGTGAGATALTGTAVRPPAGPPVTGATLVPGGTGATAYLDDRPAPSNPRDSRAFLARRRRAAALAAGATVLAGAGVAWLLTGPLSSTPAADHAPTSRPASTLPGSVAAPPATARASGSAGGTTAPGSSQHAAAHKTGADGATSTTSSSPSAHSSANPTKSGKPSTSPSPSQSTTPPGLPLLPLPSLSIGLLLMRRPKRDWPADRSIAQDT